MASRRERFLYRPVYRKVVRPMGYCLLTPIILAVIVAECCFGSSHRRSSQPGVTRRELQEKYERLDKKYAPRPLRPDHRPRPLTACGPARPLDPQPASPLFRLPAELRLRIFHEVLGGNVLHLLLKPRRVGHVVCNDGDGDAGRRCIATSMESREHVFFDGYTTRSKTIHKTYDPDSCADRKAFAIAGHSLPQSTLSISLLLSCRRAYCEAIDILYKDNVFDFNHPQTFVLFAGTILPHRLASIRSLQVLWAHRAGDESYMSSPREWWTQLWADVATRKRMPELRHVSLCIEWRYRSQESGQEEIILSPMAKYLRGLKSFDMFIATEQPFYLSDSQDDAGEDRGRPASDLGKRITGIVCAPHEEPADGAERDSIIPAREGAF
ncbi:hypothetical protein UCRNP2_8330 [Neofusicoccum parvum UCRNP2]|uniref:DUF7730 domain-containing protein n=1 Tax=Botryosphaeria parva (strain UCR-NP2) TaxID=1287680 RepID=R1G0R5_BOTPV|nr:hypothetical protein UCRNP2_8330 [Neofusicoccum parvum UCRNP2]